MATRLRFRFPPKTATIWIETDQPGVAPGWGMMPFPKAARAGKFQLLASGNGDDGALTINADARVLGATLGAGDSISYQPDAARHLYLVPSGPVRVNGVEAAARDGIAITGEAAVTIEAMSDAQLVLVDAR